MFLSVCLLKRFKVFFINGTFVDILLNLIFIESIYQYEKVILYFVCFVQEIKKDNRCGDTRGCFHDCGGDGSCDFLLTWLENGDSIDFTLTCKRAGSNVFCAVGLSKDKEMVKIDAAINQPENTFSDFFCIHQIEKNVFSVRFKVFL